MTHMHTHTHTHTHLRTAHILGSLPHVPQAHARPRSNRHRVLDGARRVGSICVAVPVAHFEVHAQQRAIDVHVQGQKLLELRLRLRAGGYRGHQAPVGGACVVGKEPSAHTHMSTYIFIHLHTHSFTYIHTRTLHHTYPVGTAQVGKSPSDRPTARTPRTPRQRVRPR
jgi:hypothetical protein